jgi:hypothetical protein
MTIKFMPKSAEILREEIAKIFTDEGLDLEANASLIDKMNSLREKDEQFKASLHEDKKKHLNAKEFYKEKMIKAGFDPKTGEKISSKDDKPEYVTKADLEKMSHRQKYAYLQDDEYDLVQSRSEKLSKSFEETMKDDTICSNYMKTIDVKGRLDRVSTPPSTRIAPDKTGSVTDDQKEFARKCGNDPDKVYSN